MIGHLIRHLARLAAAAAVLVSAADAAAQAGQTGPPDAQASVTRARAAFAAGRLDEAVEAADVALASSPASRDAVEVKIRALARGLRTKQALAAYESYAGRTRKEDARLAGLVAEGELGALGTSAQGELRMRAEALERLVRLTGSRSARADLEKLGAGASSPLAVDASLARLGDVKAALRLAERAASPDVQNKVPVIESLRAANARKQAYVLVPLLDDANPQVAAVSAQVLGALGYREALPQLRAALSARALYVRLSAAVAVRRLGDRAADTQIASMLESESPDVRLMAVEALAEGKDLAWTKVAKPLLTNPDGLTRLRAAELLLGADPAAARPVLARAAADANPVVRQEAVRILETRTPYDVKLLRGLLGDPSAWVRLHAAGALVAAAGAGTSG